MPNKNCYEIVVTVHHMENTAQVNVIAESRDRAIEIAKQQALAHYNNDDAYYVRVDHVEKVSKDTFESESIKWYAGS